MRQPEVTAVILEGGKVESDLDKSIHFVRKAIVLDTLEKLKASPHIDKVILGTNHKDLGERARALGVVVDEEEDGQFHFGRRLREIILRHKADNVITMGGAAAPLLSVEEYGEIAQSLKRERNLVIMNNVQSADLVAFSPARAIDEIDLPRNDNTLGNLLREIGLRRVLIPNSGRVNFDIDTPLDIQILGIHPMCGRRSKKAIQDLNWDSSKVLAALDVLRDDSREIVLIGRVGPQVVEYINRNMVHRVRVFSEERGMKALGREERLEVVSLLGFMIEELGPKRFFERVNDVGHVAFIDSRVIFAHLKKSFTDWDRFQGDLGNWHLVQDPFLKEFAKCAEETDIPILLGGHCLVSGGIWLMAETVVKERDQEHQTFLMSKAVRP